MPSGGVTVGAATALDFLQQPAAVTAGSPISPATSVRILDAYGLVATAATNTVTVALTTPSGATLSGTLSRAAVLGVALFNDLTVDLPNTHTLTATASGLTGTVSAAFAVSQPGAALFTAASLQQLVRSNPSSLSPTGSFTVAGWVKTTTVAAGAHPICGKWNGTTNQREWLLSLTSAVVLMRISTDGVGANSALDNTFGNLSVNTWYFLCAVYDGVNLSVAVNNGAGGSVASAAPFRGNADFYVGAVLSTASTFNYWDGAISRLGFWNTALDATHRTTLYNLGSSYDFGTLPASLKTNLVDWWDLGEAAGTTRLDSAVNLNLRDFTDVGLTGGPP